jgi:hypothetical protein
MAYYPRILNKSTRPGIVYIAKSKIYWFDYKLGFTERKNAAARLKDINTGLKKRHHYETIFEIPVSRSYPDEQKLFRLLLKKGYSKIEGKEMLKNY